MGKVGSKVEDLDPNIINLKHFEVLRAIGKGSFGKVNAVIKRNTDELLAMKPHWKNAFCQSGLPRQGFKNAGGDIIGKRPVRTKTVNQDTLVHRFE